MESECISENLDYHEKSKGRLRTLSKDSGFESETVSPLVSPIKGAFSLFHDDKTIHEYNVPNDFYLGASFFDFLVDDEADSKLRKVRFSIPSSNGDVAQTTTVLFSSFTAQQTSRTQNFRAITKNNGPYFESKENKFVGFPILGQQQYDAFAYFSDTENDGWNNYLKTLYTKNARSKFMRKPPKTYCQFCKNNNDKDDWWKTHACKDENGKIMCPILRAHICPTCGATGDDAHTDRYCPKAYSERFPRK